jgi:hypothetical protein
MHTSIIAASFETRFSCSFLYRKLCNSPTCLCSAEIHFDISCLQSMVTSQFLSYTYFGPFFSHGQQPSADQGLVIIKKSRSHSQTHTHSVGILWKSDQPFTWTVLFRTFVTDIQLCPRCNSNPHSQQASSRSPTPYAARPLGPALKRILWKSNLALLGPLISAFTSPRSRCFVDY